jgi:hypothetical protein
VELKEEKELIVLKQFERKQKNGGWRLFYQNP